MAILVVGGFRFSGGKLVVHRILSLDGGGSWAILQAIALKDIFGDIPGRKILANFDLAVANSGGSIVLGGLIEDKTPSGIIALFDQQQNRASIFAKTAFIENLLSHIPIFPKYSTSGKLAGLTKIFSTSGATPLSALTGKDWVQNQNGSDVRILIVAFDYDANRARFFRSYGTDHGARADTVPMVQAVHASSDAPVVYFDAPTQWNGGRFWDGAMAGLNNPLLAGVIDLMSAGVAAKDIVALSIGTGTVRLAPTNAKPPPPPELAISAKPSSVVSDLEKAGGCITDDPPDTATFSTHVILASARGAPVTDPCAVVRLSPIVRPILVDDAWAVPPHLDEKQFLALTQLNMDAVEQNDVDLIKALGASWLADGARNQPIRMNSQDMSNSLGEDVYSKAKKRWSDISSLGL